MESLKRILSEHPFFKELDEKYIDLITGCASNVRFNAGEFIFREGEDADKFYIIRHGKVALEIFAAERGSITIQTVEEGEVLGWSWLVPPYKWHFDARALELTRAIALDGKCLRKKCEENYEFGYKLMSKFVGIIVKRLQATRIQLLDVYGVHTK